MFFDSPVYFIFLILVVAIYWQLGCRAQNWLLLVSSYFFYGWWDYRFLLLMGASTCINYYLSHCFEAMDDSAARKRLLICALVVPEFEDHSTPIVEPHRKSKRYTMVLRRVYLGISGGCDEFSIERTRGGGFTPSFLR
jgi:hypothetical protein